jgi:glycosyltransferase involved in cell wall biosynthesis
VIPVYNGARDIRRAIDSVLAQTRPVNELIVVDDGSTDDTCDVVRSYGDKVRLLEQPNRGVAAARNYGAREARSEFIALLDHDDEWLPAKIDVQMAALERQPGSRLAYCAFWLQTIDGKTVRRHVPLAQFWPGARLRNPFPPSSAILRRAELLELGGFDERLPGASCEDWELFVRYAAAHPPIESPEPLMVYYETGSGNSRKYRQMLRNNLMIVDSLLSGLSGPEKLRCRRRILSGIYFRASLSAADVGEPHFGYLITALWKWPFPDEYDRYKRLAFVISDAARGFLGGRQPALRKDK